MGETLQSLFVKSNGKPIRIGDREVVQTCTIPISHGIVHIRLISPPNTDQGLCIDARTGGSIDLTNRSSTQRLHIWHEPGLHRSVTHRIDCPMNELLIWNIYRVHHPTGEMTEDYWTGNAGMVLLESSPNRRRYGCSDWRSPFDPSAIEFEVEWGNDV